MKKLIILMFLVGLLLPVNGQALPGFMEERMGTMSGQVMFEGKPLAKSMLAFFNVSKGLPPISGQGGRTPDMRSFADQDGKFSLRLMQGSYYIGVLNRVSSDKLGPPRQGEFFYFAVDGDGKLRRVTLANYQKVDYGVIDCVLPGGFSETEDSFTVTGVVVKGAGEDEPLPGAIVLAKTKESRYRPDYVSMPTGADGKFSLQLPPGKAFNLMARLSITGGKPNPGDEIGKYGVNSLDPKEAKISELGPPPGIEVEKPDKVVADEAISITGENGQVISGLIIRMYKIPDQKAIQEEKKNTLGAPDYEQGAALKNLLFASNSTKLQGDFVAELDLWVKFLRNKPDINIELSGYTDDVGQPQYNQHLSEKRAQVVGSYLIEKGVNPERVVATGYGEANPVADNASEDGRSRNRRVEIKFVK
ncbi:MAG: OmpA family protein [Desulfobulbaceae bacterium]|nr:OmpA family protein [Desulfobulbaceae bacterium]